MSWRALFASSLLCWVMLFEVRSAAGQEKAAETPAVSGDAAKAGKAEKDKCALTCEGCGKDGVLTLRRVPQIRVAEDSNAGSALLELKNTGSGKLTGTVCAGEFVSTATKRPLDARVTFRQGEESKAAPCYTLDLACGAQASVLVEAQGTWPAGEVRAPLLLDGRPLLLNREAEADSGEAPLSKPAELSVQRLRVPFNVTLATPGTRDAPIVVEGEQLPFVLQNADGIEYSVEWRLLVDRAVVATSSGAAPARLTPGANPFRISLPEELFPGASGLLKPKIVEGVLTVGYVDIANGPTTGPPREIPVVLSLGSCRSSVRDILRFVLCLLLLLGGGLASLFLHQSIPNRFRRLAIRTRLDAVVGQTKRLSAHIPGALRVALRVQRLELSRRLGNEVAFFPGASETYEDVAQQADVLARRIELIGKIDERLRLIEHMGRSGPPHLLHLEKRRLAGALPALSTKTPETAAFAATAQLIVEVDAAIKRIRDEDPGVREGLEKTALEYWRGRFQPQWELVAQNKKEWASDLIQQLSGFATHARRCFSRQDDAPASGALAEETLASIDTALAKMKLVVNYIRVCESATPEQEKRFNQPGLGDDDLEETQKPSQRQRFFACLSGTGARTLEQARLLLRQAAQGIFVKELAEQITRGKFRLCAEPQSVAPFDPVTFRYVFWEDKYNDAAAREKLDCVWTFKHGTEEHEEACWEAVQFFPSGGLHAVRVRVARGAKVFAPKPQALEALEQVVVHVSEEPKTHFVYLKPWRWPERAKLEGVQLGVTLVVTMGALVSGALEQIEKLDLWAAMSAIVGLGFGADVLTKIVARRPTNRPAAAQTT